MRGSIWTRIATLTRNIKKPALISLTQGTSCNAYKQFRCHWKVALHKRLTSNNLRANDWIDKGLLAYLLVSFPGQLRVRCRDRVGCKQINIRKAES
jgi:hypothetical protein